MKIGILHRFWRARQAMLLGLREALGALRLVAAQLCPRKRLAVHDSLMANRARQSFMVASSDIVPMVELSHVAERCLGIALMRYRTNWSDARCVAFLLANAVCSMMSIRAGRLSDAFRYAENALGSGAVERVRLTERAVMRSLVFSYCRSGVALVVRCNVGSIAMRTDLEARLVALIRTIEADWEEAKIWARERPATKRSADIDKRVRYSLAIATSLLAMLYFSATGPADVVRQLLLRCAALRGSVRLDVERAEGLLIVPDSFPAGWVEYTRAIELELEGMHPGFRRRVVANGEGRAVAV